MSILDDISANREQVAANCIENPALLDEIVPYLEDENGDLVTQCAAVFRIVAETHPELVAPHAWQIGELLMHKRTSVRREAIRTIKLLAALRPDVIQQHFRRIEWMITHELKGLSIDAIDAIGIYGGTNELTARTAFIFLCAHLTYFEGKYAARILRNLEPAARADPETAKFVRGVAKRYKNGWALNKETKEAAEELWEIVRWRPGQPLAKPGEIR